MAAQSFITNQKKQPSQKIDAAIGVDITTIANAVRDLNRRLRTLEERYTNLQTKAQITEQNMISRHKRFNIEVKTINADMTEQKKEIMEIKERILLMIRELKSSAKKEEVKVLQKYINLWEPLNFVTRNEVNEIIKEILSNNDIKTK